MNNMVKPVFNPDYFEIGRTYQLMIVNKNNKILNETYTVVLTHVDSEELTFKNKLTDVISYTIKLDMCLSGVVKITEIVPKVSTIKTIDDEVDNPHDVNSWKIYHVFIDSRIPDGMIFIPCVPVGEKVSASLFPRREYKNTIVLETVESPIIGKREPGDVVFINYDTATKLNIENDNTIVVYRGDLSEKPTKFGEYKTEENKSENVNNIYPLTITRDRYSGTYSGGKFHAWDCYPDQIPSSVFGDDVECCKMWTEIKLCKSSYPSVGVGDTIDEAIRDLKKKM